MLNRESLALNAGTDYLPEETEYCVGDYVVITAKNHPWHGWAAKIIGIQRGLFDTEVTPDMPDFLNVNKDLHVALAGGPYHSLQTEMIISTEKVRKIENRST